MHRRRKRKSKKEGEIERERGRDKEQKRKRNSYYSGMYAFRFTSNLIYLNNSPPRTVIRLRTNLPIHYAIANVKMSRNWTNL